MAAAPPAPTAPPAGLIIPGFRADGSIAPASIEVPANAAIIVNSKRYHLLKYLGGGTYGKVWAVLDEADRTIKTLKFIKYDQPDDPHYEGVRYEKAKKEVIVQQLVYNTNPAVCSPVYGVGHLTIETIAATAATPKFDGGKYVIFCADRYTKPLDAYLDEELGTLADSDPTGQRLVTDLLYGLYRTLKSVNIPDRVQFNHGDPNLNNYMLFEGIIRMIDLAFGHYQRSDGLDIIAEPDYNSKNNDLMRDLLQNLLFIHLFHPTMLIPELAVIASDIMDNRVLATYADDRHPFHKVFDYLDLPASHDIIRDALARIIPILQARTSTAAPLFATANAHANLAGLAAAKSATLEPNDTRAVAKVVAALPSSSRELAIDPSARVTLEELYRILASRSDDDRDPRVDPRMAVGPYMKSLAARAVAGPGMASLAIYNDVEDSGSGGGGGGGGGSGFPFGSPPPQGRGGGAGGASSSQPYGRTPGYSGGRRGGRRGGRSRSRTQKKRKTKTKVQHSKTRSRKTA